MRLSSSSRVIRNRSSVGRWIVKPDSSTPNSAGWLAVKNLHFASRDRPRRRRGLRGAVSDRILLRAVVQPFSAAPLSALESRALVSPYAQFLGS
jgi:hypothetical protein